MVIKNGCTLKVVVLKLTFFEVTIIFGRYLRPHREFGLSVWVYDLLLGEVVFRIGVYRVTNGG